MPTLDHLNMDLNNDGQLERYDLQDTRVDNNLIDYSVTGTTLHIKGGLVYSKSDTNNYSTNERLIGTWIDGKPLYEKIIVVDNVVFKSWVSLSISDLNVDTCVKLEGLYESSTWVIGLIGTTYPMNEERGLLTMDNRDRVSYYVGWGSATNDAILYITIQYTKTTDTTTIPVAEVTHTYSTQEKIVGTWIDGKTLYEKTLTQECSGSVTIDLSSLNFDYLDFNFVFKDSDGNIYKYWQYNQDNREIVNIHNNGLQFLNTRSGTLYVTIQYTKLTD